jgi:hypothetical protein
VRDVPDDNYDWHFKRAEALGFPSFSDYMRELLRLEEKNPRKVKL